MKTFNEFQEATKRDEYGDIIGGPKLSAKKLKKNLAKNEPDEKHTTTCLLYTSPSPRDRG